jgi:D-aspartate ligase
MISANYSLDTSTPAVMLKFDPNVMHHGGLGVIRSLGRAGIPVYGVPEGTLAPAASSRYLAGRFFLAAGSGRCGAREGWVAAVGRAHRPALGAHHDR